MDLYCPTCSEPFELDYITTDLADLFDLTPKQAIARFCSEGCEAWPGAKCAENAAPSLRGEATAVLFDLMPDDPDGVAAMLEDFDHMGML